MTKKKKLILAWAILGAAIIAAAAIVSPIIISKENQKFKIINGAPNINPKPFYQFTPEYAGNITFNPSNYDVRFFVYNIGQSDYLNEVFEFEGLIAVKNDQDITIEWKDKDNVVYKINKIECTNIDADNPTNYNFILFISKTYNDKTINYEKNISISSDKFASTENSKANFVTSSSKELFEIFSSQYLSFVLNPDYASNITSVSQIDSPDKINLVSSNSSNISFVKSGNNYILKSSAFTYLDDQIVISNPISSGSGVWEVNDIFDTSTGLMKDDDNPLYSFLNEQYNNGHLTFLPELTDEEINGKNDEEQLKLKIQKLIYDSSNSDIPYSFVNGNKIPLATYQAVLVKVELQNNPDSYTYLISWSKLFVTSASLVLGAPEIKMQVVYNTNNEMLTWNQLQNQQNWKFIVPVEQPQNNLVYTIKSVQITGDSKNEAIVTVEISHPDVTTRKTYTTTITSGFKSQAYEEMESQINNLIGNNGTSTSFNLNAIAPESITIKSNNNVNQVINNINNFNSLMDYLDVSSPTGLTNVKYTIVDARLNNTDGTNQFTFTFKISPESDPENYWKLGNVVQTVSKTVTLT